jgi:hypothetical protein
MICSPSTPGPMLALGPFRRAERSVSRSPDGSLGSPVALSSRGDRACCPPCRPARRSAPHVRGASPALQPRSSRLASDSIPIVGVRSRGFVQ